ncbi:MAG TPA: ATP-binding cassette domain-containing protein [Xanthobacteraceae bacterium]|nr:ATP-binding cassette domain-containing protein [Xanthobacteraceae bacterium]
MSAKALRAVDAFSELRVETRAASVNALSITIRGLCKSFGRREVLRGIDLHVPAGQFVAVVGRSGCGKSTLLRLLVGLDQPTQGQYWFGDGAGKGAPAVRIMFQEPRLLPWASVLGNVEVGLGAGRRSADARERALGTLRAVGLADRRGEWPSVLSGGQKQRVALARALVSNPQVLAFDEPLGALDALTRITMQALLERIWLAQGFTAILVTHDVAEAVRLADRVLVIEDGRVAHDLRVDLPRPREASAAAGAELQGGILRDLLRDAETGDDADVS